MAVLSSIPHRRRNPCHDPRRRCLPPPSPSAPRRGIAQRLRGPSGDHRYSSRTSTTPISTGFPRGTLSRAMPAPSHHSDASGSSTLYAPGARRPVALTRSPDNSISGRSFRRRSRFVASDQGHGLPTLCPRGRRYDARHHSGYGTRPIFPASRAEQFAVVSTNDAIPMSPHALEPDVRRRMLFHHAAI